METRQNARGRLRAVWVFLNSIREGLAIIVAAVIGAVAYMVWGGDHAQLTSNQATYLSVPKTMENVAAQASPLRQTERQTDRSSETTAGPAPGKGKAGADHEPDSAPNDGNDSGATLRGYPPDSTRATANTSGPCSPALSNSSARDISISC